MIHGWVILMDDCLAARPLGAMLGFLMVGFAAADRIHLRASGVRRLPDAAGEAAYTAQVFPRL